MFSNISFGRPESFTAAPIYMHVNYYSRDMKEKINANSMEPNGITTTAGTRNEAGTPLVIVDCHTETKENRKEIRQNDNRWIPIQKEKKRLTKSMQLIQNESVAKIEGEQWKKKYNIASCNINTIKEKDMQLETCNWSMIYMVSLPKKVF